MREVHQVLTDLQNPDLPRDFNRACKLVEELPPLLPGIRLEWCYQEDLDYLYAEYREDASDCDPIWHTGFLVPCPDMDAGRADARDGEFDKWILVVDRYPSEKENPLVTWVALNRFLAADNLVKIKVAGAVECPTEYP